MESALEGAENKALKWSYLAGYFDASGSLSADPHPLGWSGRRDSSLRISSYHRGLLEEFRSLLGGGSLVQDHKRGVPYYRFELTGRVRIANTLKLLLPYLRVKKLTAQKWILQAEEFARIAAFFQA